MQAPPLACIVLVDPAAVPVENDDRTGCNPSDTRHMYP